MKRIVLATMLFTGISLCLAGTSAFAAPYGEEATRAAWTLLPEIPAARSGGDAWVRPSKYNPVLLDRGMMADVLRLAPLEANVPVAQSEFIVSLPTPEGGFARFRAVESPIMAPELAAQFPMIHTYLGVGIDDPHAVTRFDINEQTMHVQVLSPSGNWYLDPYTRGDHTLLTSYYKRDLARPEWQCFGPDGVAQVILNDDDSTSNIRVPGNILRQYRTAVAATGEYTQFHGGTVNDGLAAVVTAINRVTGVYEIEVAVRMNLVANNNLIIYTNGATDPYTNENGSTMLGQNQTNLNAVIGSANYDLGHVFSTGGGGIASLGVVCTSSKARGVTGLPSPIGDPFYIDYVAHEMGHQFAANHTFNGASTNCSSNRNASTAYEPGSGSTIMSYAGICSLSDNFVSNSDAYFHWISIQEISNFIQSGSGSICSQNVNTGNSQPTVSAGPNYTIPSGTPFLLTATGSDPNGDPITFCWEEADLGPAILATAADNGSSPIIRSRPPTTSPQRMIPILSSVLTNSLGLKGEKVPTTNRTLNFRCTIRDNRPNGAGTNISAMTVTSTTAGGAFSVTQPNTAVNWSSGTQTVTWAVAATNVAPVNCATVDILLSTDGGNTFPTVLVAGTPNDGTENVTIPNVSTNQARVMVRSVGNIFFDISNANFTITPAAPSAPSNPQATGAPSCPGANVNITATIGPGEVIDWYTGGCGTTFVGTGTPAQLTVSPLVTTTYYGRARNTGSGLVSGTCAQITVVVYQPGDANGDDAVNLTDVDPYVDVLLGNSSLPACVMDFDLDSDADGQDLVAFIHAIAP